MNKQGYTLLEVTLFLAISGLLAVVVMVGLGPRFRNVRFTSAMREVQGTLSQEATNLNKGFNARSGGVTCTQGVSDGVVAPVLTDSVSASGSSDDCILNGRMFYFESNRLTTYDITSLRKSVGGGCETTSSDPEIKQFQDIVSCFKPRLLRQPPVTESGYPNGLVYKGTKGNNAYSAFWKGYGYLLDPSTNVTYGFIYLDNLPFARPCSSDIATCNFPIVASGGDRVTFKGATESYQPRFCFGLSSRYASLSADTITTQTKLNFEDQECK